MWWGFFFLFTSCEMCLWGWWGGIILDKPVTSRGAKLCITSDMWLRLSQVNDGRFFVCFCFCQSTHLTSSLERGVFVTGRVWDFHESSELRLGNKRSMRIWATPDSPRLCLGIIFHIKYCHLNQGIDVYKRLNYTLLILHVGNSHVSAAQSYSLYETKQCK